MTRTVPEWVGKTPDTPVPPRVRVRVFEKYNGTCYLSGIKIRPGDAWDLEDIKALINGGENRESNKAPALRDKHKAKTALDVAEKSQVARKRQKHLGVRAKRSGFPKPPPGYNAWTRRMEAIFTCLKCQQNYNTKHLPQPVEECPVCGWKPKVK